jgi:hypothetical protein
LDDNPTTVAGQVQGLFSFDLPGAEFSTNGGDTGFGVTWKAGPGLAFLANVGTSFATETEPQINGRIGASITLGALH